MASMVLVKTFFLIFLILITCYISGGAHALSMKKGLKEEPNPCGQRNINNIVKGKVMRKVLGMEEATLMDYHEPSANPSHEPRRGTPGGRPTFNP